MFSCWRSSGLTSGRKVDDDMDLYQFLGIDGNASVPSGASAAAEQKARLEREVDDYLAESECRRGRSGADGHGVDFDPLVWWKERCHRYPTVAKLAMKYLAIIPASTAPSERVFSTAKNILIKKRWRLDPGRLQRSIFLRHNHDFNPDAC